MASVQSTTTDLVAGRLWLWRGTPSRRLIAAVSTASQARPGRHRSGCTTLNRLQLAAPAHATQRIGFVNLKT